VLTKAQVAEARERYKALVARPAEDSRAAAEKQREAYAHKVDQLHFTGPLTKFWHEELIEIDTFLRHGDELKQSEKEADRVERRKFYARAYLRALEDSIRLDQEFASTGPAVLAVQEAFAWLGSSVETVAEQAEPTIQAVKTGAKEVGKTVLRVAEKAGDTAQNALYIIAGGLALAGIAYAVAAAPKRGRGLY
jgi:hypothetical protein